MIGAAPLMKSSGSPTGKELFSWKQSLISSSGSILGSNLEFEILQVFVWNWPFQNLKDSLFVHQNKNNVIGCIFIVYHVLNQLQRLGYTFRNIT